MNLVTQALTDALWNIAEDYCIFAIAFLVLLFILAILIRGIKHLYRKITKKITRQDLDEIF